MTSVVSRVVHVIDSLDPARGGPTTVACKLAGAQVDRGIDVGIVATATPAGPLGDSNPHVHSVRPPAPVAALLGVGCPADLSRLVRAADIVHLHGVWDPVLLAAARCARRAGVPYVVTPHGMLHPWSLAQSRWKKRVALFVGVRRVLDRAAAVHALNADEAAAVGRLGLRSPVRVIPNGLALADADAPVGPPPVPGLDGRPYVLFLGRLHFKKGLDYLADSFAGLSGRHPGVRLVVAGPDDGGRGPFERRVAALGVGDRVHVVGPLYGPDKWAVLARAAVFCLPSRQEGFSVAILEALARRVPVVISDTCYFPEVAAAGAGLVVPLETDKLTAALDTVLSNPAAAAAMGTAGRRLVANWYTWEKVAEQCDALYIIARTGRVPVS